jgi:hypothetical protein
VRRDNRQVQLETWAAHSPFYLDRNGLWTKQVFRLPSQVQKATTKDETVRIKAILPTEAERRLNPEDKSPVPEVFNLEGRVVEPDNLRAGP